MIPRQGDRIGVRVEAADGPVIVWHTPEEWARYWRGVDQEAAEAMGPTGRRHGIRFSVDTGRRGR